MRELCQRMSAVTMELNLKFMLTIQTIVCQLLCHFSTLQDQQIGFLTLSWKIRIGKLIQPIFSCLPLISLITKKRFLFIRLIPV